MTKKRSRLSVQALLNNKVLLLVTIAVFISILVLYQKERMLTKPFQPANQPASQSITNSTIRPNPTVFQDNGIYPSTPEKVVENFYRWYISCLNAPHEPNDCSYKTSRYVSEELIHDLTARADAFNRTCTGEGCSHGDYLQCGAQNTPAEIVVDKTDYVNGEAVVTMHETFVGNPQLFIHLKQVNNQWKITGISCPSRKY